MMQRLVDTVMIGQVASEQASAPSSQPFARSWTRGKIEPRRYLDGNEMNGESAPESASFALVGQPGLQLSQDQTNRFYKPSKYDRVVSKVVPISTFYQPNDIAVMLQDWEGCVIDIRETNFIARLRDRTRNMRVATEIAEIPIDEVDVSDKGLLCPGAIFYLNVRRRVMASGRHETISQLVFRRLPAWQRSTLRKAEEEAIDLAAFFAAHNE